MNRLKQFSTLSRTFGSKAVKEKQRLLRSFKRTKLTNASDLILYHDLLCFIRAYPDNRQIEKIVDTELKSYGKRVDYYLKNSRDKKGARLYNSGITGTITNYQYNLEIATMLSARYSKGLGFDWELNEASIEDQVDDILPHLVSWNENDALDNDDYFDLQEWLSGGDATNSNKILRALLALFDNTDIPRPLLRQMYDKLELEIEWDLTNCMASRSLQRVPIRTRFYQKGEFKRRSRSLADVFSTRAKALKRLSVKEGAKYVQVANEVLAVRNRELDPLSMASPAEVYSFAPGRGITIFLYGMKPAERLPLESNYGAMLVRNGLPIGYGVAAVLFDRVEIAINIFPAFRGGESSFIIEQFFNAFYHHFGSRVFLVRSRQLGDGDDEALHSGSFWFYYKLGFRAVNPRVRKLADVEYAKIKKQKNYRVPLATMKRLSKSDVVMLAGDTVVENWKELPLANLGYIVTDYYRKHQKNNRGEGAISAANNAARILKAGSPERWPADERLALERMAPLILSIPRLKNWSMTDRKQLAELIRAKGKPQERTFVRLSNSHPRFRKVIEKIAFKYSAG